MLSLGYMEAYMKLVNTVSYVEDVTESVDFYQRAFSKENGLEFKTNRATETSPGFEIAFETDDIQKSFDLALKEGAKKISEPTQKPWGQTIAHVADINGILVEICTKCCKCECSHK